MDVHPHLGALSHCTKSRHWLLSVLASGVKAWLPEAASPITGPCPDLTYLSLRLLPGNERWIRSTSSVCFIYLGWKGQKTLEAWYPSSMKGSSTRLFAKAPELLPPPSHPQQLSLSFSLCLLRQWNCQALQRRGNSKLTVALITCMFFLQVCDEAGTRR